MSETWQTQAERGSGGMLRLIAWIALNLGYAAGHILLYPICLYFLAFSITARRSSAEYLRRALGREPGFRDLFRHYFVFASTILDRPYFLSGSFTRYDIRIHGKEGLENLARSGRGAVLLGAHIGSFDVLRCLADESALIDLKVMMYPENAKQISKILTEINPNYARNVIPLGQPNSIMEAYDYLASGGFVGILGDRNARGNKAVAIPFLGKKAEFPLGPMTLAAVAQCPVVTFFAIYRGHRRYDVYFEVLSERVPSDYRTNPDTLPALVASYAHRMEDRCREEPYNWFNFYPFWNDGI
jgi:predicted LPLAT superfamily acyltransferase